MFVRFRQTKSRLQLSLIETRRVDGKVRHEHIASLGSIAAELNLADRVEFWSRLHERLGKLANRLGPDQQAKVMGEVHARISMVTPDEQRALQLENAKADVSGWSFLHAVADNRATTHEKLATIYSDSTAALKAGVAIADTEKKTAEARVEKIERGEAAGGFDKPMDRATILKAAGITEADARHYQFLASVPDKHFKELADAIRKLHRKGERRRERQAALAILHKYGEG